ncbi:MAG: enoyl-CoA hydratase/isomerase family protein [Sphingomonas sp.]
MPSSDLYARFRFLAVQVADGLATVTMGDPVDATFLAEQHPMHTELRDIFAALASDAGVRAAVLTGAGATFFAGPPLDETEQLLTANLQAGAKQMIEAREICQAMLDFRKPLVAAVNGVANGIGCQIAMLCDFAVASHDAMFADSHVRLGLPAGDGGTMIWPLLIGMARSRALLLRGKPIGAEEALALGIVAELAEKRRFWMPRRHSPAS